MTGALSLALALFAVLALIGLARGLGFVARPSLAGPLEAEELAQTLPGGFIATFIELAIDGGGALLRDRSGRIALIAPIGAHFLVRLYESEWSVTQACDGQLAIVGSDFSCHLKFAAPVLQWLGAMDCAELAPA